MRALAYLEWCNAVNNIRQIIRTPLRLLVWAPYLFFVVYFGYARILHYHGGSARTMQILPAYTTTIAGAYLALVGATIALAAGGRIAAFRSPAESVLFSNAGLRPLTIAVWLQLRKIGASPMRWLGGFLYLFAIAAPRQTSAIAIVRSLVVVGLVVSLAMATELPVFLLARGRIKLPFRVAGWTIATIGAVYAIAGLLGRRFLDPLKAFTHADPGIVVHESLAGNSFLPGTLVICLALLAASILLLGDDALPELYAASQGAIANKTRRSPSAGGVFEASNSKRDARIPAGALALVWKDWVGFRRGRGAMRLWIVGCVGCAVVGVAVGFAKLYFNDSAPIATLVFGSCTLVSVVAPFGASVGLANDLSKPLFWLGKSPLRARIAAWTAARAWRGGLLFGLAPTAAGIVTGQPVLALLSIPLSVVTYWSLQSLGVGLFAIFPNPLDARGPLLVVRLAITALYVTPAISAFGIISIATNLDVVGLLAATVIFAIQGYGVVELASYRFREYGASLATISRAT